MDFPMLDNNTNCITACYAEDTGIHFSSWNRGFAIIRIQDRVRQIENRCKKLRTSIKALKSKLLLILHHRRKDVDEGFLYIMTGA
ncbi:hypothetical protein X975_22293, partial [Stegodyphus mimosarum]